MSSEPDYASPSQPGIRDQGHHIYLRDIGRSCWPGGVSARIRMLKAAAMEVHRLWRSGKELRDYPPTLWRFHVNGRVWSLQVPATGIAELPLILTLDQLTRRFAEWRLDLLGIVDQRTMIRFVLCFLKQEPVEPGRASIYLSEILDTSARMQRSHVRKALERYASAGAITDPAQASAEYLADRHIALLPDSHPGERVLAYDWLREAISRERNWYVAATTWGDQLRRVEELGFDLAERPLLRQLWLLMPDDTGSVQHAFFQHNAFTPRQHHRFSKATRLADELEEEIHQLRSSLASA